MLASVSSSLRSSRPNDDPEAVGEHDRADHTLLAEEWGDHRVGHAAPLQVALQTFAAERRIQRERPWSGSLEEGAQLVGHFGVDRLHQLPVAARSEERAKRRVLLGAEQDDLRQLGPERLQRAGQQALERVGHLA